MPPPPAPPDLEKKKRREHERRRRTALASEATRLLKCSPWALYQRRYRSDSRLRYLLIAGSVRHLRSDIEAFRTSGQLRRSPTKKKKG